MSNLRVSDLMTPDVHVVHPDDPILMETHGRRGFNRLLPGSVAETVLREAPCLVLVVPPGAHPATSEAVTFKRIFWPIDFSPSALQALGFELGRPASRRARHAIARSRVGWRKRSRGYRTGLTQGRGTVVLALFWIDDVASRAGGQMSSSRTRAATNVSRSTRMHVAGRTGFILACSLTLVGCSGERSESAAPSSVAINLKPQSAPLPEPTVRRTVYVPV